MRPRQGRAGPSHGRIAPGHHRLDRARRLRVGRDPVRRASRRPQGLRLRRCASTRPRPATPSSARSTPAWWARSTRCWPQVADRDAVSATRRVDDLARRLRDGLRRLGPRRGGLQRRAPTRPSWPRWPTTPSGADAVLCATALSPVAGRRGAGGLPAAGRRVGPALGRGADRRDGRPGLRRPTGLDRCCPCKTALMDARGPAGRPADGGATVVLGVNVDDLGDHRPGQAAAAAAGAAFPLVEAGFTKDDVRALVAAARPAHLGQAGRRLPGLAPALRHPGHPGPPAAVDEAESALRALGFGQLRVRHHGDAARLEVPAEDLAAVVARRDEVVRGRARGRLPVRRPSTWRASAPAASTGRCDASAGAAGRSEEPSVIRVRVKLTFPEAAVRRAVIATLVAAVRRRPQHPPGRRGGAPRLDRLRAGRRGGHQVEAARRLAARRGHHGRPAGGRPRELSRHRRVRLSPLVGATRGPGWSTRRQDTLRGS